jgi:hypothetical protein
MQNYLAQEKSATSCTLVFCLWINILSRNEVDTTTTQKMMRAASSNGVVVYWQLICKHWFITAVSASHWPEPRVRLFWTLVALVGAWLQFQSLSAISYAFNGTAVYTTSTTLLAVTTPPTRNETTPSPLLLQQHQPLLPLLQETASRDSVTDTDVTYLDNSTTSSNPPTNATALPQATPSPPTQVVNPSRLAYVPLWPWEQNSIGSGRTCQTPIGIPEYCCLGSADWYHSFQPHVCNLARSVYERNEAMAMSLLPRLENEIPHRGVECDSCRLINVLWENNWTMAFVGDSVTDQSFVALECELHRRGYHVTTRKVPFATSADRNASDWTWKYGLRHIHELLVSAESPTTIGSSASEHFSPVAVIRMYFTYRPDMAEVQGYIAGRHDIVIFDHGLHYRANAAEFPSDMINLVTLLRGGKASSDHLNDNTVELKLLAWRETSAQHFRGPTGDFHDIHGRPNCVPLSYQVGVGDARTRAMEKVVQTLNWTQRELVLLPFREWTSHFHEMHLGGGDCTHFCMTPSFWLYEWRQIRIAVEKVLLQWSDSNQVVS